MCGRFALRIAPEEIARAYGLEVEPWVPPRYNIAPTEEIPAVIAAIGGLGVPPQVKEEIMGKMPMPTRRLRMFRWGLIPAWSKDPAIGPKLINARCETVGEKPAFREAFRLRRCLVPANGFFEWLPQNGRRLPYFIRSRTEELLSFAGLWEHWRDPQGNIIPTCSIITTPANELVAPLHDRMPAIIPPEGFAAWLETPPEHAGELRDLLTPYPADRLQAYPVDPGVSRAGVEDPAFIEPWQEKPQTLF